MEKWPKIYKIKQNFTQPYVKDIEHEIIEQVDTVLPFSHLKKGAKIAIPAGSRGIANIVFILSTLVKRLQFLGYKPFLFSAMGSHGGGTAMGQQSILTSLQITEEIMGCPVIASSEVVEIGVTDVGIKGLPVYIAKEAYESDGILLINRIKAHTSFTGNHESGLVKMMAVGMGRAKGASMVHKLGAGHLAESIPSIAKKMVAKAPIIGGLAIVENAMEQTVKIEGVKRSEIFIKDKQLLVESKALLPILPVDKIDFAVVLEMGKNFSGTGMDTNVIGRLRIEGMSEPKKPAINYLAVLDLSDASHGNANGIGLADFTTERLVSKIDKQSTYLNCITSGFVIRAAIPMTYKSDQELFEGVYQVIRPDDSSKLKMTILKNTLHIDELWVSEAIFEEIKENKNIELMKGPCKIGFMDTRLKIEEE